MPAIANHLSQLTREIHDAARTCQRDPNNITLVAVSKTKPSSAIQEAIAAGQLDFGENYVQELNTKRAELAGANIRWHFIGHLQSNKAKDVVGNVQLIHTLDRAALADKINALAVQKSIVQNCLIEVKTAQEDSKTGLAPEKLIDFVKSLCDKPGIAVKGLMTIGTATDDQAQTQKEFAQLRELLSDINQRAIYPQRLTELSMGMSHDFLIAIAEGATIIRVGSRIFGERNE